MNFKGLLGAVLLSSAMGCAGGGVTPATPASPATAMASAAPTSQAQVSVHHTVVAAKMSKPHPSVSDSWLGFRDARSSHLETLAAPLLACANEKPKRRDPECNKRTETFEIPYALTALYRLTRDARFADAADKAFDRAHIAKHDRFDHYTSSWFLAFVREREIATRDTDLQKEADAVAARLETALTDLDDFSFAQAALFGGESNVAFTLWNLWTWADHRLDTAMSTRLESYTRTRILGAEMDSWCPMPIDSEPANFEFMPPCLQRATTVLAVMPEQLSNRWLREFVNAQDWLEPVSQPRLATHGALNFSRSWGLWALYSATGNGEYRDSYVAHMEAQLGQLERAAARKEAVDPWQAALGVRALVASYEG